MAGSVNKVILIGNLGRDPEVRTSQAGAKICTLSIATSERWKDKNTGEQRERTEWHRVVIFDERIAEVAESYLRKGRPVYLEGQLQTRKWTDQAGVEKYTTEVVIQRFRGGLVLLGGRDDGPPPATEGDYAGTSAGGASAPAPNGEPAPAGGDLDDEIPF